MIDPDAQLAELVSVEPPESLDALVFSRATTELANRELPDAPPSQLPVPERWVYVAGVAIYGARALADLARLLARALSG